MKRILRSSPVIFLAALVMALLVFAFKFTSLPPQIPLFYSRPAGQDQITDILFIAVLPITTIVFLALNNFIAKRFFKGNDYLHNLIYYVNVVIVLSFSYIFIRIILLIS